MSENISNGTVTDGHGDSSIRSRHKEYTRNTILEALAELVAEGRVHDFSIQEVADRAGVSHRTVYRHFSTRETLLVELAEWLDAELGRRGAPVIPSDYDDLVKSVEPVYSMFDDYAPLVKSLVIAYLTTGVRPETRAKREKAFEEVISSAAPAATEEEVASAFVVTRCLVSSQAWLFFREQLGLSGSEAGRAVAWALRGLMETLNSRD